MIDNNQDEKDVLKINWFPGHMKKATDEIIKKINQVDFVIEILDARGIQVTSNHEIIKLINNKPLIKIALKSDLSDVDPKQYEDVLIGNIKQKDFKDKIITKLNQTLESRITKLKAKGLVNYEFVGMIVGIPNVGKSSLINYLSNNKSLLVENRAGVTKKQALRKVNKNYYLIDTPGILFKKIENIEDGYKLSILNNISNKILPLYDVIEFQYNFLLTHYEQKLFSYFGLDKKLDFKDFLDFVAQKYKFIIKNNEMDLERTLKFLFNIFSNCEICKFHF